MPQILDGKVVNEKIAEKLKAEITLRAKSSQDLRPKLVIIQVGDLPQSNAYIARKKAFGEKIGAIVDHQKFQDNVDHVTLVEYLYTVNSDPGIHGIIIQLPIPNHLDKGSLIDTIDPAKDVDGQTAASVKKLIENDPTAFIPATTKGILTLLDYYKINVKGKKAVVVGRSSLVGKPTALALLNRGATVTVCHSKTKDLKKETIGAEILVVAVGKPNLITKDHVSKNQVVIDVGINVVESHRSQVTGHRFKNQKPETEPLDRKLVGDVDFENVSKIVAAITPVPGGIGPMTVASLFENLLEAYEKIT